MNPLHNVAVVLFACFGLSLLSGFVPWVSGEVIVLSCAALLHSPIALTALALAATAGQLLGGSVLYWVGFRAGRLNVARTGRLARWRERLHDGRGRAFALVFVSSAASIPPMCLMTIAAGTSGMGFSRFAGAASCGLFVRFAVLAFCPAIVAGILR